MRPFRRFFALLPLFAFSFPAFAATQSSPRSTVQSPIQSQESQPLAAAARELARKVAVSVGAAIQGKLTIAPDFVNLSSLSSFEFQKACGAFHDEIKQQIKASGTTSAQEIAAASVNVTLAEDLHGFLWIGQVTQGQSQQTVFVSVDREMVIQSSQLNPSVTLQKEFLLSQSEPILDANFLAVSPGSAPDLLVLQPSRVALFAQQNGAWQLQSEAPIAHANPWPRDVRGRLQQGADGEEAVLRGVICNITVSTALSTSCKPGNAGWLFSTGFLRAFSLLPTVAASGNTFTFSPLGSQEFSSLAVVAPPASSGSSVPAIATTPDGRALLFEGSSTAAASFPGWGSDVAVLYSANRARWPLLVTRASDWTAPDSIQAFDTIDRQAVAISGEIDFDGPITALWSEDENTVLAVSRNLKTGMYEAYFIHAVYNR